jgi:adenylate cyclase class IV
MAHLEIEIKSLLGEKEHAEALKARMGELDPACTQVSSNTQLNHYFKGGDIKALYEATKHLMSEETREKFLMIAEKGTNFSIRSRQRNDEVLLVVKASVDEGTSANTVSRLEFEESVALSLDELDALILGAGFEYEAKWSREREEYAYKGVNVCIDKNAGYGYLAEFEKVVPHDEVVDVVRAELDTLMEELGVIELPQDRLERMFAHYNENWPDYYGTDRTFIIL